MGRRNLLEFCTVWRFSEEEEEAIGFELINFNLIIVVNVKTVYKLVGLFGFLFYFSIN